MAPFEDGQLLSEGEILESQVTMSTENGEECLDECHETIEHLSDYIEGQQSSPMFSANLDFWRWTCCC